ncbi:sugar phosphate isomerase/epimerase family protein [Snuella sedimenti]|uniref:Sugar phosphate isomerase/epimerase n=1 Tax=Snuella sedimenti TaxID=2798802 RepID=A0A8J7LTX8_9FLAO|nr:sugar phosphate isomerase/epimerase family protein [Snuella sedimenti]MBJ6368886.1 sugar phosphate isomerase/epimerase [Snuella sedimenti]
MNKKICIKVLLVSVLLFSSFSFKSVNDKIKTVESWRLGTSTSLMKMDEKTVAELKNAGFTDVEFGIGRIRNDEELQKILAKIDFVVPLLKKYNINAWSVHIPYGDGIDVSHTDETTRKIAIEEVTRIMDACKKLELEKFVMHPGFGNVSDEDRDAKLAACKKSLKKLVKHAAKYNARYTIECMPRECLGNTNQDLLFLLKVKGLQVCIDTNHLLHDTHEQFVEEIGPYVATMHAADYDRVNERHWLPGKGVINWNELIDGLVTVGYDGPFLFESAGTFKEKAECWKGLKANYKRYLEQKK